MASSLKVEICTTDEKLMFYVLNFLTFMTTTFLKQFQNFGENLIIDALHFQLLLVFASSSFFLTLLICTFSIVVTNVTTQSMLLNFNIFLEKVKWLQKILKFF